MKLASTVFLCLMCLYAVGSFASDVNVCACEPTSNGLFRVLVLENLTKNQKTALGQPYGNELTVGSKDNANVCEAERREKPVCNQAPPAGSKYTCACMPAGKNGEDRKLVLTDAKKQTTVLALFENRILAFDSSENEKLCAAALQAQVFCKSSVQPQSKQIFPRLPARGGATVERHQI